MTVKMAWLILLFASAFEIAFALGLKTTHGFTRLWPSVLTVTAAVISFVLLAQALRALPVGTGYAAWTVATQSHITNSSVLLILSSIVILLIGLVSEQIASLRPEGRRS